MKLGAIDIAIAKVQRNAGLTFLRRLCQYALDSGVRLMGSGLTDSDVGLAASVHLFAAFGIDTPVDLNGRQFIESAYARTTVTSKPAKPTSPIVLASASKSTRNGSAPHSAVTLSSSKRARALPGRSEPGEERPTHRAF